jgi:N-terminal acetyltransferase B complex non-catalytic subunit
MQLTDMEHLFVDYSTAFADWLEPYHDHARPPTSPPLTDASKPGDSKGGHPPKKVGGPVNTNGHPKKAVDDVKKTSDDSKEKERDKDREAPVVKEAPEALSKFFEGSLRKCFTTLISDSEADMKVRFHEATASKLPSEVLHIAALMQEVRFFLSDELTMSTIESDTAHQALLLLSIQSMRFKNATIVKVHKLNLVRGFVSHLLLGLSENC